MAKRQIFVVDDDPLMGESVRAILADRSDCQIDSFADPHSALAALEARGCDLLLTDLQMPGMDGFQVLERVREKSPSTRVVVMTGFGTIDHAIRAIRAGAHDFLTKPVEEGHLLVIVERAFAQMAVLDENQRLRQILQGEASFHGVISRSPRMAQVFELIRMIAPTSTTVLIEGETGTGKEQIAKAVHLASAEFRKGALIPVHCAALPEQLLESELFGHEKGSFTGATTQRKGRFEASQDGTLFLDEVGEIPLAMQVKLLRVLQERKIERVGGNTPIDIDVRVIAATNRRLPKLIRQGKFREDLYYRLNIVKIELPSLRDRKEDIPLLVEHFSHRYTPRGQASRATSSEALEKLMNHGWPGNIRELENAVQRACIVCRGTELQSDDFQLEAEQPRLGVAPLAAGTARPIELSRPMLDQIREMTSDFEKRYITAALKKTRGHIGRCSKLCQLSRRSISAKLKEYDIDKDLFKEE